MRKKSGKKSKLITPDTPETIKPTAPEEPETIKAEAAEEKSEEVVIDDKPSEETVTEPVEVAEPVVEETPAPVAPKAKPVRRNGVKAHKLTLRETLLRASLVVIFVVLIVSSIFRGFNLFQFYEILSGKQQITTRYKEYVCPSPGVEGQVDAIPLSKSFESPNLLESSLQTNLISNGDLSKVDPKHLEKPIDFSQSTYGKIDAKYSFNIDSTHANPSYVRVDVKSSEAESGASWTPVVIPVNGQTSFLYQADYRSNVVTYITLEITEADGRMHYESLGRLSPTQTWTTFRSRFYINKGVKTIRPYHVLSSVGFTETRNYKMYDLPNKLDKAMISVNFDDGWQSFYDNGLPVTDKFDIPTTQFVVASYLKNSEEYMGVQEIQELQKKGHEIGAHSLKHCELTKLSDSDLQYDLDKSKEILNKDFGTLTGFAYPFGSFNSHTTQVLRGQYSYTRTTQPGYNDFYYDPYDIKVQNVTNTTSLEQIQGWINYAVDHKLWLVLVYHEVEPDGRYAVKPVDFTEQMQAVKAAKADIVTMKTAMERIEANR